MKSCEQHHRLSSAVLPVVVIKCPFKFQPCHHLIRRYVTLARARAPKASQTKAQRFKLDDFKQTVIFVADVDERQRFKT